jgi:PKHD-type hydroxylase
MTGKKTIDSYSSVWPFNLDAVENWAYIDNIFTPDECKEIIKIGNKRGLKKADVYSDGLNQKVDENIRISKVSWLYPNEDTNWIFLRVSSAITQLNEQFFKFDLFGFIEGFQFTKYEAPTGYSGMHIDKVLHKKIRKLSITIQLSDPKDYEGGELAIQTNQEKNLMPKGQGKLVAFPSYALHGVSPVTKGTRYSLVAWITGPNFK